jgi:hypothetical protein
MKKMVYSIDDMFEDYRDSSPGKARFHRKDLWYLVAGYGDRMLTWKVRNQYQI